MVKEDIMWINRNVYDNLITENAQLKGANREQARSIATLTTSIDWMRVMLTKLDKERVALIENYMGVKVAAMEISAPAAQTRADKEGAAALAAAVAPYFTDMGDEEAARQGVSWNAEGEVVYAKKS